MCSRFSYCHGGGGYLSLYFLAERQEIKGRQSSLDLMAGINMKALIGLIA